MSGGEPPGDAWRDRPWEAQAEAKPAGGGKWSARSWAWSFGTVGSVVLLTIILSSIGNDDAEPGAGSVGAVLVSKYDQTWPKSYSSTTCAEWNTQMTSAQQWATAADMLTGARNKGDGGVGVAPDGLIDTFRGGIDTACVIDSMSLTDVGAGLYLTEREQFRP